MHVPCTWSYGKSPSFLEDDFTQYIQRFSSSHSQGFKDEELGNFPG